MNKNQKSKVSELSNTIDKFNDLTHKCLDSLQTLLNKYGKTQEVGEVIFSVTGLLIAENESLRRHCDVFASDPSIKNLNAVIKYMKRINGYLVIESKTCYA